MEQFTDQLDEILKQLHQSKKKVFILGYEY